MQFAFDIKSKVVPIWVLVPDSELRVQDIGLILILMVVANFLISHVCYWYWVWFWYFGIGIGFGIGILMVVAHFPDLLLIPNSHGIHLRLTVSKQQVTACQCSTFNISRCNFATIESHSTNWKLQDIHQKCQLQLCFEKSKPILFS